VARSTRSIVRLRRAGDNQRSCPAPSDEGDDAVASFAVIRVLAETREFGQKRAKERRERGFARTSGYAGKDTRLSIGCSVCV